MDIAIGSLAPHPANPNRMSKETFAKLKGHIKRTGRYEAIIVRPMDGGQYQILNGHHRVRVLRELGYKTARCDVWPVDETEALVLVATLNRLCGEDDPVPRETLLKELLGRIEAQDLADLLPESAWELDDLVRLAASEALPDLAPPEALEPVEFLFFALRPEQRSVVESALRATGCAERAEALVAVAKAYA